MGTICQSPDLLRYASTLTAEHLCKLRVNARALRLDTNDPERTLQQKKKISDTT